MNWDWVGTTWQWLDDFGGAIGVLAAIVATSVAVVTLIAAGKDSSDRTRPYVVAEHRLAEHNDNAVDLMVRNAGQSLARNVRVGFDPPLEEPTDGGPYVIGSLMRRYAAPLPTLAPGQELRNVWWTGREVSGSDLMVNGEPTPDDCVVTVTYEDDRGRSYEDAFDLRIGVMLHTTTSTSSASLKGRMTSIDESLKSASKSLALLTRRARSDED